MIPWQHFKLSVALIFLLAGFVGLSAGVYILERTNLFYFASAPTRSRIISVEGAVSTSLVANPISHITIPASSIFAPAE